ncbi:MAG: DUF1549 domain-containing protein [Planctomycetota bacterium]
MSIRSVIRLLGICCVTSLGSIEAAEPVVKQLLVFPTEVGITSAQDRQSMVVQAIYDNGLTDDVTLKASMTLENPAFASLEKAVLKPVADGSTKLTIQYAGKSLVVPVKVASSKAVRPISFRMDIMPIFMKSNCNTGSCHGAARGKDGFRLSLFGFDPEGDHHRLTREMPGRRLNQAVPAESTFIEKAVGAVQHTGGKRIEPGGEMYQTLIRWIEAGSPNDDVAKLPKLVSVDLAPKQAVLDGKGSSQRMTVLAKYSDGTDRDVTSLAVFLTNNESTAAVSQDGVVTAGDRGEAFVMARFETFTVGSQFLVLPKGLKFDYPQEADANYIDGLVASKLKKLRMSPSVLCDDETFLRRVYLDIIGTTPTVTEASAFLDSKAPDKRAKVIDELLGRKEFTELWVNKWAEILQIRSSVQVSYKAMFLYYNWLMEKISKNTPMDKMVQELLGANGGTFKNPATNFYQQTTDQLVLTESVAQVFMGMRIQCAQCHNHPFDRWTQDDYYGFSAFFSQIGRKGTDDYRETVVFNSQGGDTRHPVGGRVMPPKFLGDEAPNTVGKDRRVILAEWLASPRNPFFAKSFVNRVWAHFYGLGIVEPVDDFRVSNPASNPELLDELAKRFTESNYDLRKIVREICNSRTYQRSTKRNDSNLTDEKNFAHANLRRIQAESLLDTISVVTDTKDKFNGLPTGSRAVQIADGGYSTYFLTTFGRATRETPCSCEVKMEPTLSQALHLLNGDTVNQKIKTGGVIEKLMKDKPKLEDRISDLYIRCFARRPTPEEVAKVTKALAIEPDPKKAMEDLFWALLNSREFLFNH